MNFPAISLTSYTNHVRLQLHHILGPVVLMQHVLAGYLDARGGDYGLIHYYPILARKENDKKGYASFLRMIGHLRPTYDTVDGYPLSLIWISGVTKHDPRQRNKEKCMLDFCQLKQ